MKFCVQSLAFLLISGSICVNNAFALRGGGGMGGGGGGARGGGGGGAREAGGGGGFRGGAPAGGFSGGGHPAGAGGAGGAGRGGESAAGNRGAGFNAASGGHSSAGLNGSGGSRAPIQSGSRPPFSEGGAGRASTLEGKTGVTGKPGTGATATPGTAGGTGQRPAQLPGLGGSANSGDRQNAGERQQQRQGSMNQNQSQRQSWSGQNQQNRQNWANDYHGDFYHGPCAGGWYGGWGYGSGARAAYWGMTGVAVGFGLASYSNPFYGAGGGGGGGSGYDYSQPIPYQQSDPQQQTAATGAAQAPTPNQEALSTFDQAREAFSTGDYKKALDLTNQTLKKMPQDAVVHEFRGLTLFALQQYKDAAATEYAVLSAGPGWDWTTMSGLYGNVADYTTQLRALESYVEKNPKSADGHFLLAYHYLTAGHADAARSQLTEVDQLTPNDRLVRQLLGMSKPADDAGAPPAAEPPVDDEKSIKAEQLVGTWTAAGSGGSKFVMTLGADESFSWKYTAGKKTDEMKGKFSVEGNNLALQVDNGSALVADVELNGNQLKFQVAGGDPNDPPLMFKK